MAFYRASTLTSDGAEARWVAQVMVSLALGLQYAGAPSATALITSPFMRRTGTRSSSSRRSVRPRHPSWPTARQLTRHHVASTLCALADCRPAGLPLPRPLPHHAAPARPLRQPARARARRRASQRRHGHGLARDDGPRRPRRPDRGIHALALELGTRSQRRRRPDTGLWGIRRRD